MDAYFKGQITIGVEYGWLMICTCLVSYYACAITPQSKCRCTRTEMVVNTLRNPSRIPASSTRAGAAGGGLLPPPLPGRHMEISTNQESSYYTNIEGDPDCALALLPSGC